MENNKSQKTNNK